MLFRIVCVVYISDPGGAELYRPSQFLRSRQGAVEQSVASWRKRQALYGWTPRATEAETHLESAMQSTGRHSRTVTVDEERVNLLNVTEVAGSRVNPPKALTTPSVEWNRGLPSVSSRLPGPAWCTAERLRSHSEVRLYLLDALVRLGAHLPGEELAPQFHGLLVSPALILAAQDQEECLQSANRFPAAWRMVWDPCSHFSCSNANNMSMPLMLQIKDVRGDRSIPLPDLQKE